MKAVTHPVKTYWNYCLSEKSVPPEKKSALLRRGIRELLQWGRLVLSAKYTEVYSIERFRYRGAWCFTAIYLGRRAIHKKGVRHRIRRGFKNLSFDVVRLPR